MILPVLDKAALGPLLFCLLQDALYFYKLTYMHVCQKDKEKTAYFFAVLNLSLFLQPQKSNNIRLDFSFPMEATALLSFLCGKSLSVAIGFTLYFKAGEGICTYMQIGYHSQYIVDATIGIPLVLFPPETLRLVNETVLADYGI